MNISGNIKTIQNYAKVILRIKIRAENPSV